MSKISKALLLTVMTLAGFSLLTSAKAAPVAFTSGDVLLGFENSAHTLDLLVDLGNGGTLATSISNGSFSSVNLNADLITTFGADWSTNTTTGVSYGVFGLPSDKSIVYASAAVGNAAPVKKASGALATAASDYATLTANYTGDIANSQGLTMGVEQFVGANTDTGHGTWTGNSPSGTPFGTYSVSFENLATGNLAIYSTTGSASTLDGTLTLSSAGVLSAVPEPSTYALFGFGALLLIVAYRRRRGVLNT